MTRLSIKSRLLGLLLATPLALASSSLAVGQQGQQEPQDDLSAEERQSLNVRYAEADLELAELDLRQALDRNQEMPNLITDVAIKRLKHHVTIAREQLKQFRRGQEADVHEIFLASAESAALNADEEVKRLRQIHDRLPSMTTTRDLERALAVQKVAQLHLERTRARKVSESDVYVLQWQVGDLQNQVLELQHELIELQQKVDARQKR